MGKSARSMNTLVCVWLVLILAAAAGAKAFRVRSTAAALATYGINTARAQIPRWG